MTGNTDRRRTGCTSSREGGEGIFIWCSFVHSHTPLILGEEYIIFSSCMVKLSLAVAPADKAEFHLGRESCSGWVGGRQALSSRLSSVLSHLERVLATPAARCSGRGDHPLSLVVVCVGSRSRGCALSLVLLVLSRLYSCPLKSEDRPRVVEPFVALASERKAKGLKTRGGDLKPPCVPRAYRRIERTFAAVLHSGVRGDI